MSIVQENGLALIYLSESLDSNRMNRGSLEIDKQLYFDINLF